CVDMDDYFDDDDFERAFSKNADVIFEEEETSHQLEDFFGVEKNSTMVARAKHVSRELFKHSEYDEKDSEIEGDFETIYQRALEAYTESMETRFSDDPKSEMLAKAQANEFLKTALQAAKERSNIKTNKDKLAVSREKIKSTEKVANS